MAVVIWHNPKCSTSRAVLEALEARGAKPKVVEYLKDTPSAAVIGETLAKMGAGPEALLRTRNAPDDALSAWEKANGAAARIKALTTHPILIERPLVIAGRKAALVRPKAELEAILDRLGV